MASITYNTRTSSVTAAQPKTLVDRNVRTAAATWVTHARSRGEAAAELMLERQLTTVM
jgi:hypothetical protein